MAELPTGTVTFVFTDVEGSTSLWEKHPEAMKAALARHDEILRGVVESQGGYVVKTTGDGVHAAFSTADTAVGAAVEAQLALASAQWPETGALRVRIGIHTGPAELREGDYYGPALNRAARLMATAHGGQIVASLATEQLVRDTLAVEVAFLDLGEYRLRDLGQPEHVFQVTHPELPVGFAPLRTLDAYPGNLPVQVSAFIGRDRELADVAKALQEARVVTLTGVGGVGKTRLALQVAGEVLPDYRDGAWFCELAAVGEPEAVPDAIAAALDAQPRPGQTITDTLLDFLRSKQALIVLDNCEHVLATVARLVDRVERACSKVRILATSREGLAISGERIIALGSLTLPEPEDDAASIAQCDAVRLFVERAHDARAGFTLTSENADAVGQLCRRLDGIPLAIELASARVRLLTPAELVARLDQRFRLLTGGSRAALERHQTLRRTIDWSYDLLADAERRVLNRLAVFAGGFTLAAAEAVVADDALDALDALEVLDALGSLVDKSLLVADDDAGVTRYRLLETIRQYAQEQLEDAGEANDAHRRHAEHYVGLAEEAGPHLRGADQLAWLPRVDRETDNFRAAVMWAADTGEADLALRLVASLAVMGMGIGYAAIAWADAAATIDRAQGHPLLPRVLGWSAWGAVLRGDFEHAAATITAMDAASAQLSSDPHPAGLFASATLSFFSGRPDDARRYAQEWAAAARNTGDRYELVHSLTLLGAALNTVGDTDAALAALEEAVRIARDIGNSGFTLLTLGAFLTDRDPDRARGLLEEASQHCLAVGNRQGAASTLTSIAWLEAQHGDPHAALRAVSRAITEQLEIGDVNAISPSFLLVARLLAAAGRHEAAAVVLGAIHKTFVFPAGPEERHEEVVATLAQVLGNERFDELRARGAAMEPDDAVAFGCAEIDRALPTS